jgi:large subunit ribosomal protein L1
MVLSKRFKKAKEVINSELSHSLADALSVFKEYEVQAKAKFDESINVVFKLGIDAKHSDQMVRGAVPMPHGLGKQVRVPVATKAERVKEALNAGADLAGADEFLEDIKAGKLDFDILIATPDMMVALSKLGKVLGPKGLMPNPKLGTVSEDIGAAVQRSKSGQVEYKSEKTGLVHAAFGKLSFSVEMLKGNFKALYDAIVAAKPANSKGVYIREIYLSPTMGPSIKLDLSKVSG